MKICGESQPYILKKPNLIKLKFKDGNLVAINDTGHSPAKLIDKLNKIAGSHGIGRLDMVESRCRYKIMRLLRNTCWHCDFVC